MTKRLDWEKANAKPARVLSWKEKRLDCAADNWLDHSSLNKKTADKSPKRGDKPKSNRR